MISAFVAGIEDKYRVSTMLLYSSSLRITGSLVLNISYHSLYIHYNVCVNFSKKSLKIKKGHKRSKISLSKKNSGKRLIVFHSKDKEEIKWMDFLTSMTNMFFGCKNLESLDLSSFDTSQVWTMSSRFQGCNNLINLDLSHFNTSKVTYMEYMFLGCKNLESLDLNSFNTSKVKNMDSMFNSCSNLTSLDISSFDTSKVTNMKYMFYVCHSLKKVKVRSQTDIDNFKTKGTNISDNTKFEIA